MDTRPALTPSNSRQVKVDFLRVEVMVSVQCTLLHFISMCYLRYVDMSLGFSSRRSNKSFALAPTRRSQSDAFLLNFVSSRLIQFLPIGEHLLH